MGSLAPQPARCAVGVGTVNRYLQRATQCGLVWPLPAELDDAALEARLFPRAVPVHDRSRGTSRYHAAAVTASSADSASTPRRDVPQ